MAASSLSVIVVVVVLRRILTESLFSWRVDRDAAAERDRLLRGVGWPTTMDVVAQTPVAGDNVGSGGADAALRHTTEQIRM